MLKEMNFSLKGTNIVVLAKNHNPSIVSKGWLSKKNIIEEDTLEFVHTPVFSLIKTSNFNLVIDSDRLQISINKVTSKNIENLPEVVKAYIKELPETPYIAIGFNYLYEISPEKKQLKDIFSPNDEKFKKIFSTDYQIEGAVRFKFNEALAKVSLQSRDEKLTASFNFQYNTKDVRKIEKKLDAYSKLKKKAEEIVEGLF